MQNTMKSSLEYRVEIQAILQDFHLQRKFKSDFRKFSGNYEKSFYLADYGIGKFHFIKLYRYLYIHIH